MITPNTLGLIPCWSCDGSGLLLKPKTPQCGLCDGTGMIECEHEKLQDGVCYECGEEVELTKEAVDHSGTFNKYE